MFDLSIPYCANCHSIFGVIIGVGKADWIRLEKSRAQRLLWLMEELNLEYELKTYKRQNMLAPDELKEVHPLGKAPLISLESEASEKPIILAESGAIFEYLIDHFGPHLGPTRYEDGKDGQVGGETESWLRYRFYMHFAEGSLMPLLVTMLLMRGMPDREPGMLAMLMADAQFYEKNPRSSSDQSQV